MTTGIIHSKVRGVTFEGRQDIIRKTVRPGMRLNAIREPNNPHGKSAIGLWAGKSQIGYIGSDLADEIAPQMDAGKPILVTVTELTGTGPGESIGVNIVIDTKPDGAAIKPKASPMRMVLIVVGLIITALVCGAAQNAAVGIVCLAAAAWLLWQWRRSGGRWIR
jgi:hypothetical protein